MTEGLIVPTTLAAQATDEIQQLTDFVVHCPELRELEKLLGKFNLFRVLRFEHGEIRHSNVLAWLLDPAESHGLRDLFLRRWLMRVFAEAEEGAGLDPAIVDSCEFRSVEVMREWRNLDLLLDIKTFDDDRWVIAIENKVLAALSSGQLTRYRRLVDESFKDASKRLFIFLTQREGEPDDSAYVPASYEQVREVLRDCVAEQRHVIGSEPRVLLRHYLAILEELFMENSKVAELARRIYQSHRAALDVIFEYRPDERQNFSEALKQKVEASASTMPIRPMHSIKGCVRFLPKEWNTTENRKGLAFGSTDSAFVLCEIWVGSRWPLLKMVAGKVPEPWRTTLWQAALKPPFKRTYKYLKKSEMWMSFYSARNSEINLEDLELGQEEEVAEKLWEWIKQQIAKKDWTDSVKVVAQLLTELKITEGTDET